MKCQKLHGHGLFVLVTTLLHVVTAQDIMTSIAANTASFATVKVPSEELLSLGTCCDLPSNSTIPTLTVKPDRIVGHGTKMELTCVLPDTFGGKFTPKLTISLGTTGLTTKKQNTFYASSTHTANIFKQKYSIKCFYLGPENQKIESEVSRVIVTMRPTITPTSTCKPEDFQDGQSCTLAVTTAYNFAYTFSEFKWQYSTNPSFEGTVTIPGGAKCTTSNSMSETFRLDLSRYYAGYYRCWIKFAKFVGSQEIEYIFRIATNVSVSKGSECTTDSECLTYNAVCSDSRCDCLAPRDIIYDAGTHNAVACLAQGESPDSSNNLAGSTLIMVTMLIVTGLFINQLA